MNPTRSANSTEQTRRSVTFGAARRGAGLAVPLRLPRPSGVPHAPQKRCPGAAGVPQDGQVAASAAPHAPQNR